MFGFTIRHDEPSQSDIHSVESCKAQHEPSTARQLGYEEGDEEVGVTAARRGWREEEEVVGAGAQEGEKGGGES